MYEGTFLKKYFIPCASLFVLLLASCAPAVVPTDVNIQPGATEDVLSATATLDVIVEPTEVVTFTPVPLATSRGPDLEATDPSTVSLASGGLQLVEVFHFW